MHDVIIDGAGPSGLATAISARQGGLDYVVLEKGVLVNSIYRFPTHMVFFTTPELLEIGGLPFTTPYEKPTRLEALRYYRRVADTYGLKIELGREVYRVRKDAASGRFTVEARSPAGSAEAFESGAVVLAIGYYDHPNLLGVPGEDLPHVSHYYTDAHPFYRKDVVVVGGSNSAAEAALELFRSGARVTLVHRAAELNRSIKYWLLPDIGNRIREGSIRALMNTRLVGIARDKVTVERGGMREEIAADAVFLLTGYQPDRVLMAEAGVEIDPATARPCHDPETLETNVPGLFVAGGAVSGRDTAQVFIENGRSHGAKVIEVIASRLRG